MPGMNKDIGKVMNNGVRERKSKKEVTCNISISISY